MTYPFPPDLTHLVQGQMATGQYASEDDVLREAMQALAERQDDLRAIQAGIADREAGRFRPLHEPAAG
jgi:putative addiction module CopG family antidote